MNCYDSRSPSAIFDTLKTVSCNRAPRLFPLNKLAARAVYSEIPGKQS